MPTVKYSNTVDTFQVDSENLQSLGTTLQPQPGEGHCLTPEKRQPMKHTGKGFEISVNNIPNGIRDHISSMKQDILVIKNNIIEK